VLLLPSVPAAGQSVHPVAPCAAAPQPKALPLLPSKLLPHRLLLLQRMGGGLPAGGLLAAGMPNTPIAAWLPPRIAAAAACWWQNAELVVMGDMDETPRMLLRCPPYGLCSALLQAPAPVQGSGTSPNSSW
jgi:hypothetical protein